MGCVSMGRLVYCTAQRLMLLLEHHTITPCVHVKPAAAAAVKRRVHRFSSPSCLPLLLPVRFSQL